MDTAQERPTAEQLSSVHHAQEKLRALAAELAVAEERTRRHIATELRDHLAQPLALGRMKLGHVIRQTTTASVSALLQDIDQVMDRAVKFTESFAGSLTPPLCATRVSFRPSIWFARRMEAQGLTVPLHLPEDAPALDGAGHFAVPIGVRAAPQRARTRADQARVGHRGS